MVIYTRPLPKSRAFGRTESPRAEVARQRFSLDFHVSAPYPKLTGYVRATRWIDGGIDGEGGRGICNGFDSEGGSETCSDTDNHIEIRMHTEHPVVKLYECLSDAFGPMGWWPGETPFEVMVGAILTQNTSWRNVERAIACLKSHGLLDAHLLAALDAGEIANHIRSAGYYNLKSLRLKAFLDYFIRRYDGQQARMKAVDTSCLREELLSITGIGPETADSILLYAVQKPVFVVDAYTRRILQRIGLADGVESYGQIQRLFQEAMPADEQLYNEYHALLVRLGHTLCRKTNPRCLQCPAGYMCRLAAEGTERKEGG